MKNFPLSKFFKVSLVVTGLTFFVGATAIVSGNYFFVNVNHTTDEIFFRSWESKTINGEAVYNTIKFIKQSDQDVWMMNQSHHGFKANGEQLDRLAIVVKNQMAHFYQLPPGPLIWSNDLPLKKIDLKVDCRQCHSNGPRGIRPATDFLSLLSLKEKTTIFMLNLRIKFYGRLENNLWNHDEILIEKNDQKVKLKACLHCHNSGKNFWNRAHISFQQRDTIRFLVDNNQMPPKGFSLSEEERNELETFLH